METNFIYQLEVSIHQKKPNETLIIVNQHKTYGELLKFKKQIKNNYPDAIENITIKKINTEIL